MSWMFHEIFVILRDFYKLRMNALIFCLYGNNCAFESGKLGYGEQKSFDGCVEKLH